MKQHIPEEFSTRLIDWSLFVIMGGCSPQFISDSSSSPDARDQPVHLRLSRTCKNSSGRTWKGGPP